MRDQVYNCDIYESFLLNLSARAGRLISISSSSVGDGDAYSEKAVRGAPVALCGRRQRLLCLSGGTARLDANAREWRQKRKWAGDRHALMEAPRRPDRGEPLRCDIPRSICIFHGHLGTSALGLACAVAADPGPAARASGRGGVRGVDGARDRIVPGEEGAHQVVAGRSEAAVGWQPTVAAYFAGAIGIDSGAIVGLGLQVTRRVVGEHRRRPAARPA